MSNFRGLTDRQQEVLGAISIGQDTGHPSPVTKALERAGLIEGREQRVPFLPGLPMIVRRFEMPIPVHMEWCEWCSKELQEDGGQSAQRGDSNER